jgi:DNA-binding MurR/RpiR family transcriptional regulator
LHGIGSVVNMLMIQNWGGPNGVRREKNSGSDLMTDASAAKPGQADSATSGLESRLRDGWLGFGRTEQAIAKYLLSNMHEVPFETGATIAATAGVSEASVTRFVRKLGYGHLKHLKRDLRGRRSSPGAGLDDAETRYQLGGREKERLARSLEMEQHALAAAYDQVHSEPWDRMVDLLSVTERVNCIGFQAVKGLALDFATRLQWVRAGVHFVEGLDGTYSEILTDDPGKSCVLLVDTAEYAAVTFRLCEEIQRRGVPLLIVTDKYSHWAKEFTDLALEVSTHVDLYWDSMSALSSTLNLLTHAVADKLGPKAERRMNELGRIAGPLRTFREIPKRSGRRSLSRKG